MDYSTGTRTCVGDPHEGDRTSTWRFANDVLAGPLGFTLSPWPLDPQGVYFGGNDMLLTSRQLSRSANCT